MPMPPAFDQIKVRVSGEEPTSSHPLLAQQARAAQDQNLLAKEGSWTQAAQQPGSKDPGNLSPTAGQEELSPAWSPSSPGAGRGRCWGAEGCPVITATLSRGGTPGARAGPHIHRWHQGTLSTKCQIVVSFCIKNRIKKRLLLVTATRLASTTHPGDTRTRANIKIHIVQDRQGRALNPPPPPRGKQPPFETSNSEHPPPASNATFGGQGPRRRPEAVWSPPPMPWTPA